MGCCSSQEMENIDELGEKLINTATNLPEKERLLYTYLCPIRTLDEKSVVMNWRLDPNFFKPLFDEIDAENEDGAVESLKVMVGCDDRNGKTLYKHLHMRLKDIEEKDSTGTPSSDSIQRDEFRIGKKPSRTDIANVAAYYGLGGKCMFGRDLKKAELCEISRSKKALKQCGLTPRSYRNYVVIPKEYKKSFWMGYWGIAVTMVDPSGPYTKDNLQFRIVSRQQGSMPNIDLNMGSNNACPCCRLLHLKLYKRQWLEFEWELRDHMSTSDGASMKDWKSGQSRKDTIHAPCPELLEDSASPLDGTTP